MLPLHERVIISGWVFRAEKTKHAVCGQDGTSAADKLFGAAILDDDSVVVTGYSEGDWAETNAGGSDFCAARLDANGSEMWRWQVSERAPLPGWRERRCLWARPDHGLSHRER